MMGLLDDMTEYMIIHVYADCISRCRDGNKWLSNDQNP